MGQGHSNLHLLSISLIRVGIYIVFFLPTGRSHYAGSSELEGAPMGVTGEFCRADGKAVLAF